MSEIWEMSAWELARQIQARTVSSREAVEAHLRRIAEVNPSVNAVTVVLTERALQAADAADRALASGLPVGPLCGVPVTVKENIDVAGSATTLGIVPMRDAVAAADVLAPICTGPAFAVGSELDDGRLARWPASLRMAWTVNILGLPAVAVPTGLAEGLPQGVQIIGPRFREDLCLDAADAIEARTPPLTPIAPRQHRQHDFAA
ncbi:amidase family protein [Nonomuraea sp. JJY05]|uniref:amidase family protein n=1 Tax=Nonomuraea sp. JJY05 TaxID=3350255 RepID=UPI00373F15C8